MCIAIVTTAHPQFPFILLDNREEYFSRPTAPASWWGSSNSEVLGGYDLYHESHGTWLGVTRKGRVAVLTNYREEGQPILPTGRSRGEVVKSFLEGAHEPGESTETLAHRIVKEGGIQCMGGFSLILGNINDVVQASKGLAVISNRTTDTQRLVWVAASRGETRAMSNSFFGDTTWGKVVAGESAVKLAISESLEKGDSKEQLLDRLFAVLSKDTLPARKSGQDWDEYLRQLRHSIFIPPIGAPTPDDNGPSGATAVSKASPGIYGTQKQSILLVDLDGNATFVERTLFENEQVVADEKRDRRFEFKIERD